MKTEAQLRNILIKKVLEIPATKLNSLSDFLTKLENNTTDKRAEILSFSGCWKDIDEATFKALTDNLSHNRQSQRHPIDE